MESPPATMAKAPRAGATPRCRCLPEEVVIWEILVRLPPKSLLRCRAVCRAWRRSTSTRGFLLAHHGHQPSLPMVWGEPFSGSGSEYSGARYEDFLAFDHRADADAQLQPVVRLDDSYFPQASCDGLLVLTKRGGTTGTCFSFCNPVTREHAPLGTPSDFSVLGMYLHRPTGEYRLLLHRSTWPIVGSLLPKDEIGCYVFALGPDQPPRYVQGPDAASRFGSDTPTLVRNSLHWFPEQHHGSSCLSQKSGGSLERGKAVGMQALFRWLVTPLAAQSWHTDGELADSYHRDGQDIYAWDLRLKKTLVPHNFFMSLEGYAVNASPFL